MPGVILQVYWLRFSVAFLTLVLTEIKPLLLYYGVNWGTRCAFVLDNAIVDSVLATSSTWVFD